MTDRSLLAEQIINRMKSTLKVTMDKDIAAHFDIKQASVHNWRKRGTLPFEQCVQLALEKGISLDWLIIGRNERARLKPFRLRRMMNTQRFRCTKLKPVPVMARSSITSV